jgi:hypothetical protein
VTDDAVRAALRANLPASPPANLGDAIWRSVARTDQDAAPRLSVPTRLAALPRPVLLDVMS